MQDSNVIAFAGSQFVPLGPLPSACVPNEDGQVAVVSRDKMVVYFPASAANPSLAARFAKYHGLSTKALGKQRQDIPLLKVVIPTVKGKPVEWANWSNGLDTRSGILSQERTPVFRAIAWSPSGVSKLGGCSMAVLNNNFEVDIYEPAHVSVSGDWEKTFALTQYQSEIDLANVSKKLLDKEFDRNKRTVTIMACQAGAIAWSHAVSDLAAELSLLAVGHRDGSVSLWRRERSGSMERAETIRIAGAKTITGLHWTRWRRTDETQVEAILAISDTAGKLSLLLVQQSTGDEITLQLLPLPGPSDNDGRIITQMCSFEIDETTHVAYTKLGTISIAKMGDDSPTVTEIELPDTGRDQWHFASPWSPCAGLHYNPAKDQLTACLSEGTVYVVSVDSDAAVLDEAASKEHTALYREVYQSTAAEVSWRGKGSRIHMSDPKLHGPHVFGFARYGFQDQSAWLFEDTLPEAQVYRPDSLAASVLVINMLQVNACTPESVLQRAAAFLDIDRPICHAYPAAELAYLQFAFGKNGEDADMTSGLVELLSGDTGLHARMEVSFTSTGDDILREVAEAVYDRFYLDSALDRARRQSSLLKLLVAHVSLTDEQSRIASSTLSRVTKEIASHCLTEVASILGAGVQACGSDVALPSQLNLVSVALSSKEERDADAEDGEDDPDLLAHELRTDTICGTKGCGSPVPFVHLRHAYCEKNHQFERCTITLSPIVQLQTRTCMSCGRKSLPDYSSGDLSSSKMNTQEGRMVIDALLRAAKWCIYCGGRWHGIRRNEVRSLSEAAAGGAGAEDE